MLAAIKRCQSCGGTHRVKFSATAEAMALPGGFTHETICPHTRERYFWGMRPGLWQEHQVKDAGASAELPPGIQVGEHYWWVAPGGALMTAPMGPAGPALDRAEAVCPDEPRQRAASCARHAHEHPAPGR